jgi:hypothetical protein
MSQHKRFGIAVAVACAFAMAATVLGVIAFAQWGALQERQLNANWGSVPDWIAGVGTTLAFGVAAFVFWYETRDRSLTDRRSQAATITAWTTGAYRTTYHPPSSLPPGTNVVAFLDSLLSGNLMPEQGKDISTLLRVNLINASSSVIYDLVVVLECEHSNVTLPVQFVDYGESRIFRTEVTPWDPLRDHMALGLAQVLPPGQWQVYVSLSNTSVRGTGLHLFFRDSRGTYWHRKPLGQLVEMRAALPADREGKRDLIAKELGEGPSEARVCTLIPKPLTDEDAT